MAGGCHGDGRLIVKFPKRYFCPGLMFLNKPINRNSFTVTQKENFFSVPEKC